MRWRGSLPPPADVILVAIDEASIHRFGRFPWPRSLMAKALENISVGEPRAIALDILFTDPTTEADDRALAEAIARAGNVITAAQITESDNQAVWLKPLPEIERSAAGVGHVNAATGFDGVARTLNLRQSDDEAQALWAMALETVRVGERILPAQVQASQTSVKLGSREIPVNVDPPSLFLASQKQGSLIEFLTAARLFIDYIGPAGAFAERTFSIGEVIDGKVPAEAFHHKYILIGATAAGLGDRLASPFVHEEFADGRQHGELTPGVEILANGLQTILRSRFYRETPEWMVILLALLAASAAVLLITLGSGRFEMIKQPAGISCLVGVIIFGSYAAFVYWLIVPPLVSTLAACLTAAPLAWLRRLLLISAELESRIADLAQSGGVLAPFSTASSLEPAPAALIAKIANGEAAAIFERGSEETRLLAFSGRRIRLSISKGTPADGLNARRSVAQAQAEDVPAVRYFIFDDEQTADFIQQTRSIAIELGNEGARPGVLLIAYSSLRPPAQESLLLCREIADQFLESFGRKARTADAELMATPKAWPWLRGGRWKARALGALQQRLLARAHFVERALHSVDDGLLVAMPDGRVVFANPRAAEIFGQPARLLIGSDLFDRVIMVGKAHHRAWEEQRLQSMREILTRLIVEGAPVERELSVGDGPIRHYAARLSLVNDEQNGVLGIVASFSDVTKHRELQQTKNDVMALVSHEMKTPLTAIQGMSEVLAKFDVDAERGRKMHFAIHEEAQRLRRMIDEYLDITRLESGARLLRLEPARPAQILERALMMLDPIAAQRRIRIIRRFAPNLPALLLDADLIARAVTNLVSNAVKFSPVGQDVIVDAHVDVDSLRIEVADRGCGVPPDSLSRIFEKFYRVPRLENADVPGTGLGLSLVREIAELHGGQATVESEVGHGSVFALRLPLSREGAH
jgi:two-component system phosphate regulon sensor histidine kinase PhoR